MATLADSLVSTGSRKLPLRMRPDLKVQPQRAVGQTWWVIKDPVALEYYRLREEEYSILQQLDGNVSLDELKAEFDRRFAPRRITLSQLHWFIGQMHANGLISAGVPGQGHRLLERRKEKSHRKLMGTLSNLMSIRFRGFDPERLLHFLIPLVGWFFSPLFTVLAFSLILSAGALVMVQFDQFQARLPEFQAFFSGQNAVLLMVILMVTKIIHEFGHGLLCKHFGGECHEIGFMLLVFTPALYCNVSDSWMLPSKWQRAAIGAGGIYVELVLASLCTWVWWFSEPGMLHHLCLNVMFISSVSTIMFNANPLLRYDGYYILSDLMEVPNLWEKSRLILHQALGKWCLGLKPRSVPLLPTRKKFWLCVYAVLSSVYRWFVTFSILWFLNEVFKPYRLQILGQMLALMGLYGLVVMPLWKAFKFFMVPGRAKEVKEWRFAVSLTVFCVVVLVVWYFPLPNRVMTTLVIEPRNAQRVYVEVPGVLDQLKVKPGDEVRKGAELAQLSDPELVLEIAKVTTQRDRQAMQVRNLERRQSTPQSVAKKAPARKVLEEYEEQLKQLERDKTRLLLTAPAAGMVWPPPPLPDKTPPHGNLPRWTGVPIDPRNAGALLEAPTLFCLIGDPREVEAALIIDQADIDFVHEGQDVAILLDELPGETFQGRIHSISVQNLDVAPESLATKSGGSLRTRTDRSGVERPLTATYRARVHLTDPAQRLLPGFRGRAKIHAGHLPLGSHLVRYLSETFHFKL